MTDEKRAPTVEFKATRENGQELFFYYVAGCCGARSTASFNYVPPKEFIKGMVDSGISGNVMVMIDAKTHGDDARAFAEYVEENELGKVVISQGINNQYTDAELVTVVFEYRPSVLVDHIYGDDWSMPKGWYTTTDKVCMDEVFYQLGGRPRPASRVQWDKVAFAMGEEDEADSQVA